MAILLRTIILVLAGHCFGVVSASEPALSKTLDEVAAELRKGVVLLAVKLEDQATGRVETKFATGFVVASSGFALTAAHALRLSKVTAAGGPTGELQEFSRAAVKSITARLWLDAGHSDVSADLISVGSGYDVALLKLGIAAEINPVLLCGLAPPQSGSPLYAFGFAKAYDLAPLNATFGHANGPMGIWQVAAAFTDGTSGGPVTAPDGRVVGMIKGGIDGAEAVRWVIPINYALPQLELGLVKLENCETPIGVPNAVEILPLYPDRVKPLKGLPAPIPIADKGRLVFERGADIDLIFQCRKTHPKSYIASSFEIETRRLDVGGRVASINVDALKALGPLQFDYLSVVLQDHGTAKAYWTTNTGQINPVKTDPSGRPRANLLDTRKALVFKFDCAKAEEWPIRVTASLAEPGARAVRFKLGLSDRTQTFYVTSDWVILRATK